MPHSPTWISKENRKKTLGVRVMPLIYCPNGSLKRIESIGKRYNIYLVIVIVDGSLKRIES